MEIPAWCFISFWAIVSFTFIHLGFLALDETKISVSPAVMFLFKHSEHNPNSELCSRIPSTIPTQRILIRYILFKLKIFFGMIMRLPVSVWNVISVPVITLLLYLISDILSIETFSSLYFKLCASMVAVLTLASARHVMTEYMPHMFIWIPITYFVGIFCVLGTIFACLVFFVRACKNFTELKTRSVILLALEISLFFVSEKKGNFYPIVALYISHFIFVIWAAAAPKLEDNSTILRISAYPVYGVCSWVLKHKKVKKYMEFAVGTMGAFLFQYFFKITTFREVEAFLCFAVAWLANLVLLGYFGDLGIFNFLLANVVVGCTVGAFGLHGHTWAAYGAVLLLFGLRLKLESVLLDYGEGKWVKL